MMGLLPRDASIFLDRWRVKSTRKPLILRGARQVGKSSLVRLHAQQYSTFIELNLERTADRLLFDGLPSVQNLVDRIALRAGVAKLDSDTLLFIDEIQESPEAIQQLRFLYEDFPELHVIAAGSLLEFALGDVKSFPVGRVEYYVLRPLSFREYLQWIGKDVLLSVLAKIPVASYAHDELLSAFRRYAVVGGMPEIVHALSQGAQVSELTDLYEAIWAAYRDDAEKYARNDKLRGILRHLMATAATEDGRITLANFGGSTYRSDDIKSAFRALELAGVLRLMYPTTSLQAPATPVLRKRPKIQLLDTGLLNHARRIHSDLLGHEDLASAFRGRIAEHIVTQEHIATHHQPTWSPMFWTRESPRANAEVDLVFQHHSALYPLEIKAGAQGRLRSLHEFVERANTRIGFRVYGGSFSIDNVSTPSGYKYALVNLPYYLIGDLDGVLKYVLDATDID